jgi:hypothetical protein
MNIIDDNMDRYTWGWRGWVIAALAVAVFFLMWR